MYMRKDKIMANNCNSEDVARRATAMGVELMCCKALDEIEVMFGCMSDMKAKMALSPGRIQHLYDYMDLPKDPFEFLATVPAASPEVTTMRRNLRIIIEEIPEFDPYDLWFKSDTIGDLDEVVLMIRAEKQRIATEYQKHFKEFERRYGNE